MSKKKVLSKFTILCWATFTAILDRMQSVVHGLDPAHSVCNKDVDIYPFPLL